MLEKLGITKDTPDPEGGRYGRLDDGTPNGYMEENAFIQVVMGMPAPSDEEIAASYAEAQKVYASHGITTAQDGMTSTENAERLEQFGKSEACYMDIVGYADLRSATGAISDDPYTYHGRCV